MKNKVIGKKLRPLTKRDIHGRTSKRATLTCQALWRWVQNPVFNDQMQSFIGWTLIAGCVALIIFCIARYLSFTFVIRPGATL